LKHMDQNQECELVSHRESGGEFVDLRASGEWAERFYRLEIWRQESPIDDLWRWRKEAPESLAIIAHRADSGIQRISYREYAEYVERFAGALHELGVGPGQVVAVQLPNWWQVNALVLACARLGAVVAPVMTSIRSRELERVLTRLQARVCVTTDHWAGYGHAAGLAEMAARLPWLRHRVVLGACVADDELDFIQHFQQTPWELTHQVALNAARPDPDRVFLVLFTSGTTGEPKAALHTLNTLYASCRGQAEDGFGAQDRFFCPHALTHAVGAVTCILTPLLLGAGAVIMDTWEPETAVAVAAEAEVSYFIGAPVFLSALAAAVETQARAMPALRVIASAGTTIPEDLVAEVPKVLGLPLRALWGMTEIVIGTATGAADPPDWAAHSVGRPTAQLELDLRAEHEIPAGQPAWLLVRGGGVCLATLARDSGELTIIAERNDGWYDTGDLAVPDGRGGIQLVGRAADRIGSVFMIPVRDVETALRTHPTVGEVALVGYRDSTGRELACAVITAPSTPPTLAELRQHLDTMKMTEWYQPSRLEVLPKLPRNATGKILKELLRRWLRGEAELP